MRIATAISRISAGVSQARTRRPCVPDSCACMPPLPTTSSAPISNSLRQTRICAYCPQSVGILVVVRFFFGYVLSLSNAQYHEVFCVRFQYFTGFKQLHVIVILRKSCWTTKDKV